MRPTRLLSPPRPAPPGGSPPSGPPPARGRASTAALAARLTPRNLASSVDARGLLAVAFDLADTGSATATSTRITVLGLGGLLLRARRRKASPIL